MSELGAVRAGPVRVARAIRGLAAARLARRVRPRVGRGGATRRELTGQLVEARGHGALAVSGWAREGRARAK